MLCGFGGAEEIIQESEGAIVREGREIVYYQALEGYILRYDPEAKKLVIFTREGQKRVQAIDGIESLQDEIPRFYCIDINMDGFEDIAYTTDCGYNCAAAYLVFDPESARFIPNAVDLFVQSIDFNEDARIFTTHTATSLFDWVEKIYAPDGHDFPVLQEYRRNVDDENHIQGEFRLAEDFEAVSKEDEQARFSLRVEIGYLYGEYTGEAADKVGVVIWGSQKQPLTFRHAEIREYRTDENPKSARYSFDEWENGKTTGEYSFTLENGAIKETRYIHWKDRQIFDLVKRVGK
jgi:hypothetical protein